MKFKAFFRLFAKRMNRRTRFDAAQELHKEKLIELVGRQYSDNEFRRWDKQQMRLMNLGGRWFGYPTMRPGESPTEFVYRRWQTYDKRSKGD